MKTKCMSCGGSMKKMAVGGTTTKRIIKKSTGGMYGIPQENMGTSSQYGFAQKGGAVAKRVAKMMQNGGITKGRRIIKNMDPGFIISPKKPYTNMDPGFIKSPKKRYKNMDPGFIKSPAEQTRTIERNGTMQTIKKPKITTGQPLPKKMKTGGATKATKFAALAPPYDKATFADRIVGAKKNAGSKKLPKAQLGAFIKGVVKYGSKGAKIGARAGQKNKALTNQAIRIINLEKRAPGSKRKLMDKVMLNQGTSSERKQIANLFDRISKIERTRANNKDLRKVFLGLGSILGGGAIALKTASDYDKRKAAKLALKKLKVQNLPEIIVRPKK